MIDLKDLCGESEPPECKNFEQSYFHEEECCKYLFYITHADMSKTFYCNIHRTGGRGPGECPYPWLIF
jgi:hypothetical protein